MIKLFAHRGFVTQDIAQNSIESLQNAWRKNFRAVEFDIWFFQEKLILKHDKPNSDEINFLPQFSDYLCFKNDIEYWADFKNLDENNADKALNLVKLKLLEAGVGIEQIYFAPFITDHEKAAKIFVILRKVFGAKVKIMAVCEELESDISKKNLRNFLDQNNIKNLSIFHKIIDADFMKIFSDVKIFAWTVNDKERLLELEQLGVRNFATDKIIP